MSSARSTWAPVFTGALLAMLIVLDLRAAPAPTPQYVFISTAGQQVSMYQGQDWIMGELDADGNFTRTTPHRTPRANFLRSPPGPVLSVRHDYDLESRVPAYEFRSGRLIRGVQEWDGTFVP